MSYCTLLITKKSETELIKKEISQNYSEFARDFAFINSTKYYSQKDFKNISQIYNGFSQYDVVLLENYYSSFTHQTEEQWRNEEFEKKIKRFRKKGWSDDKIKEYREKERVKIDSRSLYSKNSSQNRKNEMEKVLFSLANNYFIAFLYYWQWKDVDRKEWNRFKEMKKISEPQGMYEENVIYKIY